MALHSDHYYQRILFIYGTFRNEIEDHVYEQGGKIMETVSVFPRTKKYSSSG